MMVDRGMATDQKLSIFYNHSTALDGGYDNRDT